MERKRWYKDKVFYQVWPRSFKDGNGDGMGDLWGVYEKLDYIKSLGCDGIWFSPIYPSPGADGGYDIADYMDIAPEFGGMEAFMLVTGVIDHQIHDDLHVPFMGTVQHLFEGLHAAEFRSDVHIVGDVIAAVGTGGGVDGGEPDAVTAQGLDVIQLFVDAPQVTHAVAVTVLEGTGPYLIEYLVFVPAFAFHKISSISKSEREIVVYRASARMQNAKCRMQNYGIYFVNDSKHGR